MTTVQQRYDYLFKTPTYYIYNYYTVVPHKIYNKTLFSNKLGTKSLIALKNYNLKVLNQSTFNITRLNFHYLKFNMFKAFFSNSGVEIPDTLLHLKTLTNSVNQITVYKFNNYLTLHGLFIKSLVNLNLAYNTTLVSGLSIKNN